MGCPGTLKLHVNPKISLSPSSHAKESRLAIPDGDVRLGLNGS
jgi:hypothetical protein